MTKDIIHFAHANGFPARTYTKLFSFLAPHFEVRYLERHGHDPAFPVTDGWSDLKDELIADIEKRYTAPVIGVGHSLGGILHFLAAIERPEIYKQIILLDAPIISRLSSSGLRILKTLKLIDRYSPSQMTRFRRNVWESREEALGHFAEKAKFAAFDPDVLRDYVEYGIIPGEQGLELFFERRVEARIYRTIPHSLPAFRGRLSVPAAYIGGTNSEEARLARLGFMKKHFPFDFYSVEGSHLFPLEKPFETAARIIEILGK
jgi:pimeloyl-ACP methyl ester carboxylesterase